MSAGPSTNTDEPVANGRERRPFRAVDVLTGSIDQRPTPVRVRKQISAQLEPGQVRLLGELHARLNATATTRIEKSDLVGLGIELLAAVLAADGELAPAPDQDDPGVAGTDGIGDLAGLRAYVRTHVRGYATHDSPGREKGGSDRTI
jgi:hypothetical protein